MKSLLLFHFIFLVAPAIQAGLISPNASLMEIPMNQPVNVSSPLIHGGLYQDGVLKNENDIGPDNLFCSVSTVNGAPLEGSGRVSSLQIHGHLASISHDQHLPLVYSLHLIVGNQSATLQCQKKNYSPQAISRIFQLNEALGFNFIDHQPPLGTGAISLPHRSGPDLFFSCIDHQSGCYNTEARPQMGDEILRSMIVGRSLPHENTPENQASPDQIYFNMWSFQAGELVDQGQLDWNQPSCFLRLKTKEQRGVLNPFRLNVGTSIFPSMQRLSHLGDSVDRTFQIKKSSNTQQNFSLVSLNGVSPEMTDDSVLVLTCGSKQTQTLTYRDVQEIVGNYLLFSFETI